MKRLDKDYDHAAAGQAQELQERKQRSEANRTRRIVKHPGFKNFNSKEAENYLAPLESIARIRHRTNLHFSELVSSRSDFYLLYKTYE
jgi:hypothetical protein